ncbi:hypothetical protein MRB53_022041 [Persea americana]|uniref:Uncharacterized protein n=1 Tax=Persea americana TaxID=3435 RepID=A0ACC2L633_PERAE|nr:hypothetical protein MRB53_022041 [Persea americana]
MFLPVSLTSLHCGNFETWEDHQRCLLTRSLTTSLTSPAPSSSSRATSTRTPVRGIKTSKRPVAVVV